MTTTIAAPPRLMHDPGYAALKRYVIESTGLAYYDDRDDELAGRLEQRMQALGIGDCAAYLALLERGPHAAGEFDLLVASLTIGETHFFRHREMFDALRNIVLPDVIERNRAHRRIRIWSAGCSIGAETYSLAILLHEVLAQELSSWNVDILGTDINRDYLARAQQGCYDDWSLRAVSEEVKRRYFQRVDNHWQILPRYRQGVRFQYHNLVKHPFPSLIDDLLAFDVILCRNVMIYFSRDLIRQITAHCRNTLGDGGWLILGPADPNRDVLSAFETVMARGAILLRKPISTLCSCLPEPPRIPQNGYGHVELQAPAPGAHIVRTSPAAIEPARPEEPCTPPTPLAHEDAALAEVRRLADSGRLEQAAERCAEALETDHCNARLTLYLAILLEQMGQVANAMQCLQHAVYLDRTDPLAHYHLGLMRHRAGQERQAAHSFHNVLALLATRDPDDVLLEADGMCVADLEQLTRMHAELLKIS